MKNKLIKRLVAFLDNIVWAIVEYVILKSIGNKK
jgi:hypothetical protein